MRILLFILIFFQTKLWAQLTPYELQGKNYSATYPECIQYYQALTQNYRGIQVVPQGETDAGLPLHVVLISSDNKFSPKRWHQQKKCVILINNAIHPGEPDGIDASMMLVRESLQKMKDGKFPDNICLAIIPVYNIGGALNRSPYYRVDQNGPDEFGSRGNSQNLDLNRDFIKCDSKEARTFAKIFHWLEPDIFVDNHVSDGADYPYVLTMATTQKDKLGSVLGPYLHQKMEPDLQAMMKERGFPFIPYVNVWGKGIEDGWSQFFDSPRYSSGYATLFNTLAFVPETHMLKPYADRVEATYQFMSCLINYAAKQSNTILALREKAKSNMLQQSYFPIQWSHNPDKFETFNMETYAYVDRISKVSGLTIKQYDRSQKLPRAIKFYNQYQPADSVKAPLAYIIPQGWYKVIDLLKLNGVKMITIQSDTTIPVEAYRIKHYKSSATPYEGHHPNEEIELEKFNELKIFRAGDVYISLQQPAKRYLIETLEPHAMDSYFTWNFFDPILNQKEGFTAYAFEEKAEAYLELHPDLKMKLHEKVSLDTNFAKSPYAQLDFIYKNSLYYEPQHNIFPVYRLTNKTDSQGGTLLPRQPLNKQDE